MEAQVIGEKMCKHEFELTDKPPIEGEQNIYREMRCKNCGYTFVKKIPQEVKTYPELERFKKYIDKPFVKTIENEEIINLSLEQMKLFISDGKTTGLLFHDKRGTGKTHLAVKILKQFKRKFHKRIFALNYSLFYYERIREINMSKQESIEIPQTYMLEEELHNAEVILLDEIGKGKNTDWSNGMIYSFIESVYREPKGKFLVITTNIKPENLDKELDPAIASRLYELCKFVSFNHLDDMRRL